MFSITDRLIDRWHFEQTFCNHSSCKFLSLWKVIWMPFNGQLKQQSHPFFVWAGKKKNWLLRGPAGGKAFARFNLYSKVTQWNLILQPIKRLSKNKAMTGKRKNYIQPSAKKNLQKFWNTAFVLWFLTNRRGPQFSVDLRSGFFYTGLFNPSICIYFYHLFCDIFELAT